jgi:cytochrome c6
MKKYVICVLLFLFVMGNVAVARAGDMSGKELFEKHCAMCHPGGDNVMNKSKTLHDEDLKKNGIETADDIVNLMRNPGPGMLKFDHEKISDDAAKKIAEYVLEAF